MIWRVSVLTHQEDDDVPGLRRDHTYRLIADHILGVIDIINRFNHQSIIYIMIEPIGLLDSWRRKCRSTKTGLSSKKERR
ncbi:MAG: hypothetical protein AAAB35_01430 [Phyllobacterium sp.]|uniref:hypothetical protein n=1 Tax=Phyllobacterium sp. TaxID=1871046 RepID=UPI0030EFD26E